MKTGSPNIIRRACTAVAVLALTAIGVGLASWPQARSNAAESPARAARGTNAVSDGALQTATDGAHATNRFASGTPALPVPTSKSARSLQNPATIRVAPGRVELVESPRTGLVRFGPVGGPPRLTRGGVLVFSRAEGGETHLVLDSRSRRETDTTGVFVAHTHEGAVGGARYPSPGADDDADGRVDEDRLDGVDNDGDDRVDEDFAAAGDEMAVCRRLVKGADATPLSIYEEHCAWSLPHIDGLVVSRYVVRNEGTMPVSGVRLGVAFDVPTGVNVGTRPLDLSRWNSDPSSKLAGHALEIGGTSPVRALLFCRVAGSSRGQGDTSAAGWAAGVLRAGTAEDIARRLREDRVARDAGEESEHAATSDAPEERSLLDAPDHTDGQASPGAESPPPLDATETVWAASPGFGTLEPGSEVSIFVGLLLPPRGARAMSDAIRTIVGDGTHRMIPPPMWSTRRIVWGAYVLRMPPDPAAGVEVTLFRPRDAGVDPARITYLQRVGLRHTLISSSADGNARFDMNGRDLPKGFADGGKVTLRGHLRDGQWFDAVLEPAAAAGAGGDATAWLSRPGSLDDALLSGSPNPFRDGTTIAWEVPAEVTDERGTRLEVRGSIETSVKVYDVTGRLVSTLFDGSQPPGQYREQWQARNAVGVSVASGVYYVKLQIGRRFITRRLTQLK